MKDESGCHRVIAMDESGIEKEEGATAGLKLQASPPTPATCCWSKRTSPWMWTFEPMITDLSQPFSPCFRPGHGIECGGKQCSAYAVRSRCCQIFHFLTSPRSLAGGSAAPYLRIGHDRATLLCGSTTNLERCVRLPTERHRRETPTEVASVAEQPAGAVAAIRGGDTATEAVGAPPWVQVRRALREADMRRIIVKLGLKAVDRRHLLTGVRLPFDHVVVDGVIDSPLVARLYRGQ